jgi:transcription elongation factor GreA
LRRAFCDAPFATRPFATRLLAVQPPIDCLAPAPDLLYRRLARPARIAGRHFFVLKAVSAGPAMIEELKQKLGDEVQRLQHELNVVLPNEIRKAVELGDLRENSEYKAALERQQFVQARLGQLRQRLSKLSQIDLAQIPTDKVGLGSKVVVQDQQTKNVETYSLVFGDSVEFEEGHVSMGSPIGRALVGKGVGDDIILKLPTMTRRLRIVELVTIHQGALE